MYAVEERLLALQDGVEKARTDLKAKLTRKGVSFNTNDTLRKLISLIPRKITPPINLYGTLYSHVAVNVDNTRILISGGTLNNNPTQTHKLYNATNKTFVSKANCPTNVRYEHAGAKWRDAYYYFGGAFYQYNLNTNTFTSKNYHHPWTSPTLANTIDFLLLSGGNWGGSTKEQLIYNDTADTWTEKLNLRFYLSNHSATDSDYINNKVLISGGYSDGDRGPSNINDVFNINSNTFTQKTNLPQGRVSLRSLKINNTNSVLINGGTNVNEANTTKVFDVNANIFINKKSAPTTWTEHTLAKIDNDFLISGGEGKSKQYVYTVNTDEYI